MPYSLSRDAESDLADIYLQGLRTFGRRQADRYLDALYRTFDLLSDMPLIGRLTQGRPDDERRFVHNAHVIFYRVQASEVRILRVIYGAWLAEA